MSAITSLRLLSVATLLTLGAQPAAAQSATSSNFPSPAFTGWGDSPTGKYVLELAAPNRTNRVNLTISDSAGGLAAAFQPIGDRRAHEMTVRLQGADMILLADTPSGMFQIVLARQADRITGHWYLGDAKGAVRGRVDEELTIPQGLTLPDLDSPR
jgi:hypothetical protein